MALPTSSGASALHVALLACNLGPQERRAWTGSVGTTKNGIFHGENDDKSVDGMGVRISVNVICEQYPMVVQVFDSSKVGETG